MTCNEQLQQVSVVIAAKNSEHLMEDCLKSIRANRPREIIVVDGLSTDATMQKALPLADKVISDYGKGIGYARQIGAEQTTGDYVAFVGPDNIVPDGALKSLLEELQGTSLGGIQPQVRVLLDSASTYWDRGWNWYLVISHPPGERHVIGTPALFPKELLLKFKWDAQVISTDDTDLCLRLRQQGYRVGVGRTVVYEKQRLDARGFYRRWRWYGIGDARFIRKYMKTNPAIAIRHFFHPLRTYIVGLPIKSLIKGKPQYVPFFVLCGVTRYLGFWQEAPRLFFPWNKKSA